MKVLALAFTVVLLASQAFAVVDPQQNSMGFYFDLDGNEFCRDGVDYEEVVFLYLVLTHLTEPLYAFEAGFEIEGEALVLAQSVLLFGVEPHMGWENLMLILSEPHPVQEAIPLFRLTVLNWDNNGGAVNLYLHGSNPSSLDPVFPTLFFADMEMVSANMRVQDQPSAQINGDCVTGAGDPMSLSALKALYR